MDIKELILKDNYNSFRDKKRVLAIFIFEDGKKKQIKFGQRNAFTFFDGASNEKRRAYISRHRPREEWGNILTRGALARWVLWEETNRSIIEKNINRRFGIKKVKVLITRNKEKENN